MSHRTLMLGCHSDGRILWVTDDFGNMVWLSLSARQSLYHYLTSTDRSTTCN